MNNIFFLFFVIGLFHGFLTSIMACDGLLTKDEIKTHHSISVIYTSTISGNRLKDKLVPASSVALFHLLVCPLKI